MHRCISIALVICATMTLSEDAPFKAAQQDDYAAAMKAVAAKFKGTPGVYIQIGDSITYANQNTAWARGGQGQPPAVQQFLKWSHRGEKNQTDGWWLAADDQPGNRSNTAASGVRASDYLMPHGQRRIAAAF